MFGLDICPIEWPLISYHPLDWPADCHHLWILPHSIHSASQSASLSEILHLCNNTTKSHIPGQYSLLFGRDFSTKLIEWFFYFMFSSYDCVSKFHFYIFNLWKKKVWNDRRNCNPVYLGTKVQQSRSRSLLTTSSKLRTRLYIQVSFLNFPSHSVSCLSLCSSFFFWLQFYIIS